MIALNRRRMMGGGGGSPLPYDAEVEYLQGDGSAYIDTGIGARGNLQVRIQPVDYFTPENAGLWLFGGRVANNNAMYGMFIHGTEGTVRFSYGGRSYVYSNYSAYPASALIQIADGTVSIGTTSHTYTKSTFTAARNVILFGLNNGGTIIPSQTKIASAYMTYEDEALDLIAVRIGQVGYMYDRLSGQLFGNAGSGSFILGADKN